MKAGSPSPDAEPQSAAVTSGLIRAEPAAITLDLDNLFCVSEDFYNHLIGFPLEEVTL